MGRSQSDTIWEALIRCIFYVIKPIKKTLKDTNTIIMNNEAISTAVF